MPLTAAAFPIATEYDPVEDPPGSIDPLGTLTYAERLADVLFPGLTGRMYRPRLLTMATVAAAVSAQVVQGLERGEEGRLEARLAFERLVASALARKRMNDSAGYTEATRRLPGRLLAQKALSADEPLTRQNFLRGQAVNGASGVILRLARHLQLIDEQGRLGRCGRELLLVWAEEEGLQGILDELPNSERPGAKWIREVARITSACVSSGSWPSPKQQIWDMVCGPLRLDGAHLAERKLLYSRLTSDTLRGRMIELLEATNAVSTYSEAARDGRELAERAALVHGVRPALHATPDDRAIAAVLETIESYEQASGLFQQAFDGISWALKRRGGRAHPGAMSREPRFVRHLEKTVVGLRRVVPRLDAVGRLLDSIPPLCSPDLRLHLQTIRDEACLAAQSHAHLLDATLTRHERVQREKRKSAWIDRDGQWTLMPGFGFEGEDLPAYGGLYLHPFRVVNMYSFLVDLHRVQTRVDYGEPD